MASFLFGWQLRYFQTILGITARLCRDDKKWFTSTVAEIWGGVDAVCLILYHVLNLIEPRESLGQMMDFALRAFQNRSPGVQLDAFPFPLFAYLGK